MAGKGQRGRSEGFDEKPGGAAVRERGSEKGRAFAGAVGAGRGPGGSPSLHLFCLERGVPVRAAAEPSARFQPPEGDHDCIACGCFELFDRQRSLECTNPQGIPQIQVYLQSKVMSGEPKSGCPDDLLAILQSTQRLNPHKNIQQVVRTAMKQNPHVHINYFKSLKLLQRHSTGVQLQASSQELSGQEQVAQIQNSNQEVQESKNPMTNFKFQALTEEELLGQAESAGSGAEIPADLVSHSVKTSATLSSPTQERGKKAANTKSQNDKLWTGPLSGNHPNLLWRAVLMKVSDTTKLTSAEGHYGGFEVPPSIPRAASAFRRHSRGTSGLS
eukprot:764717-Hanusia_phi.AAC.3